MRHTLFFTLTLAVNLNVFAQNRPTFRADRDTAAEAEIKRMEFLLTDLIAKGDIDTYSGYLTDDYVRVAANGVVSTKEEVLTAFRTSTTHGTMMPHDLSSGFMVKLQLCAAYWI